MTPNEAKQLCIEAHSGQFRRKRQLSETEKIVYSFYTYQLSFSESGKASLTTSDGSIISIDTESYYYISEPYSTHPIAVAEMMETDEEKIIALLHDVIEDTDITYQQIKEQFGIEIAQIILLLTKEHNNYEEYIGCLAANKIATKVKLADIYHNLSCQPSQNQRDKYLKALPILLKVI